MTEIRPLPWGRRYLMCRPEHFRVDYAINPWMDVDSAVDPERALAQWDTLVATLESAGAEVERIAQLPGNPDMVYAMNYGLVDGDHVALTNFRYDERRRRGRGRRVVVRRGRAAHHPGRRRRGRAPSRPATPSCSATRCWSAAGPRTDLATHAVLSRELGVRVASVPVVHPALYHLDLSFCPLDETRAIVAPAAWDAAGRRDRRRRSCPSPLVHRRGRGLHLLRQLGRRRRRRGHAGRRPGAGRPAARGAGASRSRPST